jgi:hypothetical protein
MTLKITTTVTIMTTTMIASPILGILLALLGNHHKAVHMPDLGWSSGFPKINDFQTEGVSLCTILKISLQTCDDESRMTFYLIGSAPHKSYWCF